MKKSKIKNRLLLTTNLDPAINTKNRPGSLIDLTSITSPRELHKFLWSDKQQLLITGNNYKEVEESLKNTKNANDFISICDYYDIILNRTNLKKIETNFKVEKTKLIENIIKKQLSFPKTFSSIYNKAKKIQQEENIYTLYVAAYFLTGEDIEKTKINAPLLLWEVTVHIKNGEIKITKNEDMPTINEKFNYYLNFTYGIDLSFDDNSNSLKILSNYNQVFNQMTIKNNFELDFIKFMDSKEMKLSVENYACLTLVEPLGGAIKKDIETIESRKQNPFKINNEIIEYSKLINDTLKNESIIDLNRPLNIYQKYAVKAALERNVLIYGPPGTGKSETIASIIANIIYKKKNILMVSEKMAALEVLEKRLGKLSQAALFAFKPEHKEKFYMSLENISNALHSEIKYDPSEIKDNIVKLDNAYQRILKQIKSIFNIEKELSVSSYVELLFDILNSGDIEQVVNIENTLFSNLNKFTRNNFQDMILMFKDLSILHNISRIEPLAFEIFKKYKFTAKNQNIINFLKYYEQNKQCNWSLKKFIKNKKSFEKEPLIKLKLKHETSIIRSLELLQSLSINEIKVKDFYFVKELPQTLFEKDNFEKYIAYNFIKENFARNNYEQFSTLQSLNEEYQRLKKEISKNNDQLIFNQYINDLKIKINNLEDQNLKNQIFEVLSKISLKRKPAINTLIKKYYKALRLMFPIWVLNPNQTAILNPCEKGIFDFGIFDEASQMFLEKAYPLVYRCKINIVSGDDKQLQPSSFFLKKVDEEDDIEESLGNSLFEQANVCLWAKFYLKNHYRSDSSELISFSNKYIYDNNLEFATKNKAHLKPIIVHNVNGLWENRINEKEITTILEIIKNKEYKDKTILIVTFNNKQSNYLENYFSDEFYGTQIFEKYMNGKISIRNLENVQGDEADIVILSISYGPDAKGKVNNFFGPLSQQNGSNRLNVAITRAKEQMIIVKSLDSKDVKSSDNQNNNIFKYFLNYVEDISNLDAKKNKQSSSLTFENSFENDIYEYVRSRLNKNQKSVINYQVGKKSIDIAIVDIKTEEVILGIQIDKFNQLNSIRKTIEEIDRQNFLEDLGYKMLRILEIEWKTSKFQIISKINKILG
ncbi:MAG: AAA domain-containing protein, partial [Mycoplasma sp.]